jgi:hypothetical protein
MSPFFWKKIYFVPCCFSENYTSSKAKIKLSLCLYKHHAIETYVCGGILPCILTLTVHGDAVSFIPLYSPKNCPRWTGVCVGSRDSLEAVEKRIILYFVLRSNTGFSDEHPVA